MPRRQDADDRLAEPERRLSGDECEGCGTSLAGRRPQARFCTDACRVRTRRNARLREWLRLRSELDRLMGVRSPGQGQP